MNLRDVGQFGLKVNNKKTKNSFMSNEQNAEQKHSKGS
jgi:hypothetical protein